MKKHGKKQKINLGRTSHEVRGLKYIFGKIIETVLQSHLTRGAWIEITETQV